MDDLQSKDTQSPSFRKKLLEDLRRGKSKQPSEKKEKDFSKKTASAAKKSAKQARSKKKKPSQSVFDSSAPTVSAIERPVIGAAVVGKESKKKPVSKQRGPVFSRKGASSTEKAVKPAKTQKQKAVHSVFDSSIPTASVIETAVTVGKKQASKQSSINTAKKGRKPQKDIRSVFNTSGPTVSASENPAIGAASVENGSEKAEQKWGQQEPELHDELKDTVISPVVSISQKTALKEDPVVRRRRNRHHKKQEKAAKRIVAAVVLVVLLAIGITGYSGYSYIKASLDPINAESKKNIQVEIPEGSSTKEIGNILVKNNLIKNATIFNYYSKLKSYNNFQSGYYNLNQSMSVDDLAKALQESGTPAPSEPIEGKVLIIEGYTIEQIAKAVTDNVYTEEKKDKTRFKSEEFLETVKDQEFIQKMVAAYPRLFASLPAANSGAKYQLEGYLFPATYEYSETTTTEGLIEKMIAAMDANLQPYYDQLDSSGLSVNQILTLASLVEKEGATDEDRRNIASVFYNRINTNMPLQSNIAILYAMGKLGEETTLAEDAAIDTKINSPYNIYVHTGLMPGPVDSPSLAAIEATISPNTTTYYYFVADVTTGTVYYSETIEEHNKNVEKYVNSKLKD